LNPMVQFGMQCALLLLSSLATGNVDVNAQCPLRTPIRAVRNRTTSLDPSDLSGWEDDAVLSVVLLPPVGIASVAQLFHPPKVPRVHSGPPFIAPRFGRPFG